MKFLLVEDDEKFAGALKQVLAAHCYLIDWATDGEMAEAMAEVFPYDLLLLDWMLPKLDGIQVCQRLRAKGDRTPIIVMTAREASTDKVAGLDAGADDYLIKPFEVEELLARIRAVLRRAAGMASPILQWGELRLDPSSTEVSCHSTPIALTPKEYSLLELFLRNPRRVFSPDDLLDKIWSFESSPHKSAVRTHIKALRQKLKQAGLTDVIETVYGLGYRLAPPESTAQPVQKTIQDEQAPVALGTADGDASKLDLAALWQPVRSQYLQRVTNLANTLLALRPGVLDETVRQQLVTEAHALKGSLGCFGFPGVTTQCQGIEQTLRTNAYLSSQDVHQLGGLITQVWQTLAQTAAEPASGATPVSASLPLGALYQLLVVKPMSERSEDWWYQSLAVAAVDRGVQIKMVDDIAEARGVIAPALTGQFTQQQPDIVLLELGCPTDPPDNDRAALQLLAELRQIHPPILALVLTAQADFENRVRVARLGVARLLQTPVTPTEVLDAIAQILQKGAPPAAKLLIVDDDPDMLSLLQHLLQPWGFRLQLLVDPQGFWEMLEQFQPDLVILDVEMPQASGFDLCQVLRNDPHWQALPVLFLSAHTDAQTIQRVFAVGADDYIRKPIVAPELVARVLSWLERARIQRLRADSDSLTGVTNRRKSTQDLSRLLGLAHRQGQPLCFALIDLDNFKRINDAYGHAVGDRILRRFGECLRSAFRGEDVVARWGGEEFMVGLYGVSQPEGTQRLRQFLSAWQQERFTSGDHTFHITFSAGVAMYPHNATDLQGLYRAADGALYQAKAAGRNQVLPTV